MEGVTARDVMSREFAGVSEGDDVADVLALMADEATDEVLVLRGSDPVGQVAAHDVLRLVADGDLGEGTPVESVMHPPAEPVDADSDLSTVLSRLTATDVDRLPVANGDRDLVGIVSESDVIAAASTLVSDPHAAEALGGPETVGRSEGTPAAEADRSPTAGTASATTAADTDEYNQGVCESCGTLSADLRVVNGQSICPECRDR